MSKPSKASNIVPYIHPRKVPPGQRLRISLGQRISNASASSLILPSPAPAAAIPLYKVGEDVTETLQEFPRRFKLIAELNTLAPLPKATAARQCFQSQFACCHSVTSAAMRRRKSDNWSNCSIMASARAVRSRLNTPFAQSLNLDTNSDSAIGFSG